MVQINLKVIDVAGVLQWLIKHTCKLFNNLRHRAVFRVYGCKIVCQFNYYKSQLRNDCPGGCRHFVSLCVTPQRLVYALTFQGNLSHSYFDSEAHKIWVFCLSEKSVFNYQISLRYVPGGNHHIYSSERLGTSLNVLMVTFEEWDKV